LREISSKELPIADEESLRSDGFLFPSPSGVE
jgi:hypothetical protein